MVLFFFQGYEKTSSTNIFNKILGCEGCEDPNWMILGHGEDTPFISKPKIQKLGLLIAYQENIMNQMVMDDFGTCRS